MSDDEKRYGLYYRYGGKLAKPDEPERLIHVGSEAECERVMRARKLVKNVGQKVTSYVVKPVVETKKSPKPFKRKR